MAEEYQQSLLHRGSEAEEEGESKSGTLFASVDAENNSVDFVAASVSDELATAEGPKDRGFLGFKVDKPMMENISNKVVGDECAVEATNRGLFGNFMGKKEEKVDKDEENEVATEFEKMNVSEPDEKEEKKLQRSGSSSSSSKMATEFEKMNVSEPDEKEEKKLQRSGSSSSSSSSDEEEEAEDGEKKKKKKKGLKEKIKGMVSGGDEEKEVEKPEINMLEKEVEKPENNIFEKVEAPYEKPAEMAYYEPEADQAEEKKGFMDKTTYTEDTPATTRTQESEQKEKKGLLEKIKEKLPGYNTKTT